MFLKYKIPIKYEQALAEFGLGVKTLQEFEKHAATAKAIQHLDVYFKCVVMKGFDQSHIHPQFRDEGKFSTSGIFESEQKPNVYDILDECAKIVGMKFKPHNKERGELVLLILLMEERRLLENEVREVMKRNYSPLEHLDKATKKILQKNPEIMDFLINHADASFKNTFFRDNSDFMKECEPGDLSIEDKLLIWEIAINHLIEKFIWRKPQNVFVFNTEVAVLAHMILSDCSEEDENPLNLLGLLLYNRKWLSDDIDPLRLLLVVHKQICRKFNGDQEITRYAKYYASCMSKYKIKEKLAGEKNLTTGKSSGKRIISLSVKGHHAHLALELYEDLEKAGLDAPQTVKFIETIAKINFKKPGSGPLNFFRKTTQILGKSTLANIMWRTLNKFAQHFNDDCVSFAKGISERDPALDYSSLGYGSFLNSSMPIPAVLWRGSCAAMGCTGVLKDVRPMLKLLKPANHEMIYFPLGLINYYEILGTQEAIDYLNIMIKSYKWKDVKYYARKSISIIENS